MKFLLPIILIVVSGSAFFAYIDPTYGTIQEMRKEEALFNEALNNSKKLQAIRDDLLAQYNSFLASDVERLKKLMPDNVDNVRLVRDIDGIAAKYGMTLRNVTVEVDPNNAGTGIGKSQGAYGSVLLTFSIKGPYRIFESFLADLEKSLRVVDVVDISFNASEQDLYEYTIVVRTYWLK